MELIKKYITMYVRSIGVKNIPTRIEHSVVNTEIAGGK